MQHVYLGPSHGLSQALALNIRFRILANIPLVQSTSTVVTSLAGPFWQSCFAELQGSERGFAKSTFLQVCRGRDLLADIQSANVSIEDAAREAGLSSFYFIRCFRALFGETPHQFRTRQRLTAAQKFLAQGWCVTDVCMEVGFSSLGSFSSLFTRRIGLSPTAYQRSLRRSFLVADWAPHPPNCLLLMGGRGSIAIFEKTLRQL
jgi:AraC-like DNA-binding protein